MIRNEATLKLSAQRSGCVLPEGFHGDYEDISYEVVSVTVGETPVEGELSAYASISGDTLTVNRVEGVTDYTVQVQAEYGPEGSKKPANRLTSMYPSISRRHKKANWTSTRALSPSQPVQTAEPSILRTEKR